MGSPAANPGRRDRRRCFASASTLNSSPISAGRQQLLHRRGLAQVRDRGRLAASREPVEDAAADQERRLRRDSRATARPPRSPARAIAREVDVRGEVGQPRPAGTDRRARDAGSAPSACPRGAAGGSTRAAESRSRSTSSAPRAHARADRSHQRLGRGIDLAHVVAVRGKSRLRERAQRASAQRAVGPARARRLHATPRSNHAPPRRDDHVRRHRVEHFVQRRPRRRCVRAARRSTRRARAAPARARDRRALPLAQIGAHFEDAVARRQRVRAASAVQQVGARARRCPHRARRCRASGVAARIAATGVASARANSGVISGAVTKSPAAPNLRAPAA